MKNSRFQDYLLTEALQDLLSASSLTGLIPGKFRFGPKENKRYKWLFGAYGFYQAFDNSVDVDAYTSNLSYIKTYDHTIDGYAFFHQSTLTDFIVKNLSVTARLRLDSEKDLLHYTYDRTLRGIDAQLADTVYPALNSLELIPRFALNYKILKSNLYAVVARGYKTGGFNSTFERPEDLTFEPEFSWIYEIGIKSPLFKSILEKVNRESGLIPPAELFSYIKSEDDRIGVNFDFIYGLPGQSVSSFTRTMQMAADIRPDRLVTFSYAHVPWVKKHQLILEKRGLPTSGEKTRMFLSGPAGRHLNTKSYGPLKDHHCL